MSKLSEKRKTTYYVGMGMMILGCLLFMSTFFTFATMFSRPMFTSMASFVIKPVIGMLLMISGTIVMNIGAKGAAGSGIILDPEQAREDLKPFNEAKGGMINDVVSNIDVIDQFTNPRTTTEVIRIKCRSCGALNEEDAKYCKSCGSVV